MKLLLRILSLFRPARPRRIFNRTMPVTLGKGMSNAKALHAVLCCTRADAIRARHENYRRSIQRVLNAAKN